MVQNKFFSAELIAPRTWRITNCFDSHARMTTYSYLLEGDSRAMVIDTMFGYGNLKTFCRELTDRPLFLVNTHYHGDHAGGNFDFDECYIHALDIPYLKDLMVGAIDDPAAFRKARYEQMKNAALPENRDMILPTDFSMPHPVLMWPVWDGDLFELGNRTVEVIHVGGHTAGEIVLLDRATHICITGDACNSNTLLNLPGSISVEEYLESLRHFKKFQGEFDRCHGGHEDFDASIIDEGIELVERVLVGTDEHWESEGMRGGVCYYGMERLARETELGTRHGRRDGKSFNIAYLAENVRKTPGKPRVL